MIRRGFWLAAGAVLGVTGYRKAARLARTITVPPALTTQVRAGRQARPIDARPAEPRAIESRAGVPVTHRIRAAARFARDVRDGMAEYRDLHPRPLGRRLGTRSSGQPGDRAPASRGGIQP